MELSLIGWKLIEKGRPAFSRSIKGRYHKLPEGEVLLSRKQVYFPIGIDIQRVNDIEQYAADEKQQATPLKMECGDEGISLPFQVGRKQGRTVHIVSAG